MLWRIVLLWKFLQYFNIYLLICCIKKKAIFISYNCVPHVKQVLSSLTPLQFQIKVMPSVNIAHHNDRFSNICGFIIAQWLAVWVLGWRDFSVSIARNGLTWGRAIQQLKNVWRTYGNKSLSQYTPVIIKLMVFNNIKMWGPFICVKHCIIKSRILITFRWQIHHN